MKLGRMPLKALRPMLWLLLWTLPPKQFKKYVQNNNIGARAWHDQPIGQIYLSTPVKAKVKYCWSLDHIGSRTARLPESHIQALQVATFDRQVASLKWVLPLRRGVTGVFYSPNRSFSSHFTTHRSKCTNYNWYHRHRYTIIIIIIANFLHQF